MPESRPAVLRIWEGADLDSAPDLPLLSESSFAEELYRAETLRVPSRPSQEPVAPLSLAWYLEAQQLRYARQGSWLPAALEFNRHTGETVLGLGGGLGSDWVGYALNGCNVICISPLAEQRELIQRNFDLRRLPVRCEQAPYTNLPLAANSVDVACLAGPVRREELPATLEELYRVLKPGGKILFVTAAARSIESLYRWLPGGKADEAGPYSLLANPRLTTAEIWKYMYRFGEAKISRRHLRRAEVPTLLRLTPLLLLERLAGRLLVYKGFKPLSAARVEAAAA
ncbi:MAG: class I SAM-dependent methyltransferase [Gemmataceae bacterium]